MGAAMAHRLLGLGHALAVWNRDPAKAGSLIGLGAAAAQSPASLAAISECVITMLLNDAAIDNVYRGPEGILSGDLSGKLIIDMSTVRSETEEALAHDVAARGGRFIECPVGGSVGPAREGKLLGLAGGSEADMAAARPVLEALCRRVEHVGPVGAGQKMKLAVNLPLMVYWQALGEALSLAKPLGLEPARLVDILSDTSGTPTAMKARGPDLARLLAGERRDTPGFSIEAANKDLGLMLAFAERLGADVPVTAAAAKCYAQAQSAGLGDGDPIHLPVFWLRRGTRS
jgi:3-hydroxyisobutyrate dehydrogenase